MTAWACVQISDLLRRANDEVRCATETLDLDPTDIPADLERTMFCSEADRLKRALLNIVEIAEQLEHLAEGLPADDDIRIAGEGIGAEAAADLANGILDPRRALLAAGVLDRRTGFGALAEGLRCSEAHAAWTEEAVEDMLSRFRGADPLLVRDILSDMGLSAGTSFANLDAGDAARLAAALAHRASSDLGR
jgi:hypothetical protein